MSKWLIRKASGSRRRYKLGGDYSDTRNSKVSSLDDLPKKEEMSHNGHTNLDTTPVKRWLHSKVGKDFDQIYAEFLTRIQPKYLDKYRECIFWYVEKNIEIKGNGEIWGERDGQPVKVPYSRQAKFYVHPDTNKLVRFAS